MKKFLVAAVLVVSTAQAQAESETVCEVVHSVATAVMSNRQAGVPVTTMMGVIENAEDNQVTRTMAEMVKEAYSRSRFQSESIRQRAIEDFANDWATKCYLGSKQ